MANDLLVRCVLAHKLATDMHMPDVCIVPLCLRVEWQCCCTEPAFKEVLHDAFSANLWIAVIFSRLGLLLTCADINALFLYMQAALGGWHGLVGHEDTAPSSAQGAVTHHVIAARSVWSP